MFDVAFSEMLVIAVIALIVIGPEKLPKVARTLGLLAGRMQRYVATVKADVERELRTEELGKFDAEAQRQVSALESAIRSEVQAIPAAVEEPAVAPAEVKDAKPDAAPGSP
jgi:sec-independent protein translocase protein TatB